MSTEQKTQQVEQPTGGVGKATHYGLMALTVGLGVYIWWATTDLSNPPQRPTPSLYEGAVIDAPITLITADKHDLACAADKDINGYHCEFKAPNETWPNVNTSDATARKQLLVPYKTIDDLLFLVPGLFEESAVDERYRDEPPQGKTRDKLERFTAQCKLTLVKEASNVMLRWHPTGQWQGPSKAWIGVPSKCQVSEP